MGAKQSKRSVDISGKEAESGGEVAAAGGGAEGRVEALADVDALKPQVNGDAHIHESTDKEKQLDSGTPENEKDATTEKQEKEQQNGNETEKESTAASPVTNGEPETKEGGDTAPTPEDGKKPKKEKVKKKWSLRSISFSRKDKPKQEKKHKEEEPKINGETEKVPEEAAEATPDPVKTEVIEEAKAETETKEEKPAETPVTEPLTNGSSTPESKAETPASEEAAPAPEPQPEPAPTPAPADPEPPALNGLSLDEPKTESAPETKTVESSLEKPEPIAETETTPAPEIPVAKEVCVEKVCPESPPPPLPANPPPPSVVSFAASTMAPELTAASLPNTDEVAPAPHSIPSTDAPHQDSSVCSPLEAPVVMVGPDNFDAKPSNTVTEPKDKLADNETPLPNNDSLCEKTIERKSTEISSFTNKICNVRVECVTLENAIHKNTETSNGFLAESVNEELKNDDILINKPEIVLFANDLKQSEGQSETMSDRVEHEVNQLVNESNVVLECQSKIVTEIEADEFKQSEDKSIVEKDIVLNTAEKNQGEPEIISELLDKSTIMSDIVDDGVKQNKDESEVITEIMENCYKSEDENKLISEIKPKEVKEFEAEYKIVPEMEKDECKTSNDEICEKLQSEIRLQSDTQDTNEPHPSKVHLLTYTELVPEIAPEEVNHFEPDVSTDSQDISESLDDLPPPPPPLDEETCNQPDSKSDQIDYSVDTVPEPITDSHDLSVPMALKPNGPIEHVISVNEFKEKDLEQGAACNGEVMQNGEQSQSVLEDSAVAKLGAVLPAPPHAAHPAPQEPTAVSDKLAELMPEVPVIPDLNTETLTETTKDVAVNN